MFVGIGDEKKNQKKLVNGWIHRFMARYPLLTMRSYFIIKRDRAVDSV